MHIYLFVIGTRNSDLYYLDASFLSAYPYPSNPSPVLTVSSSTDLTKNYNRKRDLGSALLTTKLAKIFMDTSTAIFVLWEAVQGCVKLANTICSNRF